MPIDMKRTIAEAVQVLLIERHVKKLTVKDIVEPVSYTHLDVYKRQGWRRENDFILFAPEAEA